jgi:four helix bundle protein
MIAVCRSLPPTWETQQIARQLFRCGASVGSNYRAACRGCSRRDFVARLGVVVEEADESVFWLSVLAHSGIADGSELRNLLREAQELMTIFSKSVYGSRKPA